MNGILYKMDLEKVDGDYFIEKYPSMESLISFVVNKLPLAKNAFIWNRIEEESGIGGWKGYDWYGFSSLGEILEAGRGGWKEGLRLYYELKSQIPVEEIAINSGFSKQRKKRVYGEEGGDIDVCRYINKEYDTMFVDRKPEKVKGGKCIVIWTSPIADCTASASRMMWRGISAVVLTDILENAGYRVCLKSYAFSKYLFQGNRNKKYIVEITLKNFGESLNIETSLMAAGCPAFHRYYLAKHKVCMLEAVSGGLGQSQNTIPDILAEEGDIMMGDLNYLNSKESAIETIKDILEQLNEGG